MVCAGEAPLGWNSGAKEESVDGFADMSGSFLERRVSWRVEDPAQETACTVRAPCYRYVSEFGMTKVCRSQIAAAIELQIQSLLHDIMRDSCSATIPRLDRLPSPRLPC